MEISQDQKALFTSVIQGDVGSLKSLMVNGTSPNFLIDQSFIFSDPTRPPGPGSGYDYYTPLSCAVIKGNLEIVECLLSTGLKTCKHADPDFPGYLSGKLVSSPLIIAIEKDSTIITRVLLNFNASPRYAPYTNLTPMAMAVQTANSEVMWVLRERGARVDCETDAGDVLFHFLCHINNEDTALEIAELLIEWGTPNGKPENENPILQEMEHKGFHRLAARFKEIRSLR